MPESHFDRLDAYRQSLSYAAASYEVVKILRSAEPPLADQLMRAVCSISLNIAEGAGEFSVGDKARFYRYALRSTTESIAVHDLAGRLGLISEELHARCRESGIRQVAILTRLVLAMQARAQG